ncbi:MAG: (d)CMP kinase [Sediminibacterium sp.]|nr:(d)CMP kinase [Sediminibacterium sp.]
MRKIIITIDGYSSCGKSTLAKQMAQQLNYVFIDSGAMYRAITLYFLRHQIDPHNNDQVKNALNKIQLKFDYNATSGTSDILLNDENVELQIRDMQVSEQVSDVAANQFVREFAVAQQQQMGEQKGIVMDGRDIGTTVFPHAELKIFVTADPLVRAQRRFKELSAKNPAITIEEVSHNLEMRDHIDSNREFSPLRKATDAIVLDNTHLSREDQLNTALKWAQEKLGESLN